MTSTQILFFETSQASDATNSVEQIPSIEFLEFIGGGVKLEGEFLDPMNYEEIETGRKEDRKQTSGTSKKQQDDE